MPDQTANIWIVDDVHSNRSLFASIVETLGHEPRTFPNGEEAVAAAEIDAVPDLVLLDVMMPGMDGFESCRALRRHFADQMVPIVMITANPDRKLYSRGLEAGADDYLFQPIDVIAIQSRISAMLRLRNTYRELATTKEKLTGRVELLRREVADAEALLHLNDRLQSVGMMVAGIAHELKNPLGAVRFNLDWVTDKLAKPDAENADEWRKQLLEAVEISLEATGNLEQLVADLSTFARPERHDNRLSVVRTVVDSAVRVTRHSVMGHASIDLDIEDDLVVDVRPRRLAQVVINMLVNAAKAIARTGQRGTVRITAKRDGDDVEISVHDSGIGLPADSGDIFEPFYTTDAASGTGLGLAVCAQIVRRSGGEIGADASELGGARFWLRLSAA